MDLSRRKLLGFAPLLVAAPAIVRAASLMPVKPYATGGLLPPGNYLVQLDYVGIEARSICYHLSNIQPNEIHDMVGDRFFKELKPTDRDWHWKYTQLIR